MLPQHQIEVAGIAVAQDQSGRFSLNDLHRAAMAGGKATDSHRPGNFLKSPSVDAFIRVLTDATSVAPVETVKGGPKQGSYAVELLVMRYAAWIDPEFELRVYQSFQAVAAPAPAVRVAPTKPPVMVAAGMAPTVMRALRSFGIDKNAAAIGANQIINKETGVNLLALAGHTHLVTPTQEICFTPTELGHRRCVSARTMNRAIAAAGLQELVGTHWVPTEKGRAHAVVLDTGKMHGSGTPIQQVKWRDSVISELAL